MRWYGELGATRMRQIAGDLLLLAWAWLWWRLASRFRELVSALATPGERIESGGDRLAGGLADVADRVGDVPLAGDALRVPFEALSSAAEAIADAGATQQQVVLDLATWSFWLLLILPVLAVALPYLALRVQRARQAAVAVRLRATGDLHLLAVRAAANRPLARILEATDAPGRDLQEGRPDALAALELRSLGLRPAEAARADRT